MFSLLRIIQRSGGLLAVMVTALLFAFYGIALLSVEFVQDPSRAVQILVFFLFFSAMFIFLLLWTIRSAFSRVRRPIENAVTATSRFASKGRRGGRDAIRLLGRKILVVGKLVANAKSSVRCKASCVVDLVHRVSFRFGRRGSEY